MPKTGYDSFAQAKNEIINYIVGYYSQVRPHQHILPTEKNTTNTTKNSVVTGCGIKRYQYF